MEQHHHGAFLERKGIVRQLCFQTCEEGTTRAWRIGPDMGHALPSPFLQTLVSPELLRFLCLIPGGYLTSSYKQYYIHVRMLPVSHYTINENQVKNIQPEMQTEFQPTDAV